MHSPKQETKILFIVFSITAMLSIGISSVSPVLPLMGRHFGTDTLTTSLVITAFTLPGLLFLPLAGFLADRYGRKPVLVPCLIFFAASGVACAWIENFNLFLLFRMLQGISSAPFGMLSVTIIGDNFKGQKLGQIVGYNGTVMNIALALAPSVGGSMAVLDWRLIFLLPLLALPVLAVVYKHPLAVPKEKTPIKEYAGSFMQVLNNRKILLFFCLGFFNLFLIFGPMTICFPILADRIHDAHPAFIGYLMGALSISAAMSASLTGRVVLKTPPAPLLLLGQCLYLIGLVAIPNMPSLWFEIAPVMFFGAGLGICTTTVISNMVSLAPDKQRASLMSVYGMIISLAQTTAPVVFGSIIKFFVINTAYYIAAGMTLCMMTMVFLFGRQKEKH